MHGRWWRRPPGVRLAEPWWDLSDGRRQDLAQPGTTGLWILATAPELVDSDDRLIGRSAGWRRHDPVQRLPAA